MLISCISSGVAVLRGTEPGSVKIVLKWATIARNANSSNIVVLKYFFVVSFWGNNTIVRSAYCEKAIKSQANITQAIPQPSFTSQTILDLGLALCPLGQIQLWWIDSGGVFSMIDIVCFAPSSNVQLCCSWLLLINTISLSLYIILLYHNAKTTGLIANLNFEEYSYLVTCNLINIYVHRYTYIVWPP